MAGVDNSGGPVRLPRPDQLDTLSNDQIVAVVMRLAMEVSVLRDRLLTHEALLAERQILSSEDVDDHTPSKEESAARQQARTRLIESIINDLSED